MREIKFRVWDKEHKRMFRVEELSFEQNGQWNVHRSDITWKYKRGYFSHTDYELMQYTGLKDKNGKEIYEGDVVTYYRPLRPSFQGRQAVVFKNGSFTIGETGWYFWDLGEGKSDAVVEIVGNIYENPEFLEGTNADLSQK